MKKVVIRSVSDEVVVSRIHTVRGQKVMLDSDLAELYQVETRALNQAVKRNSRRFPEDFMFALTAEEWENLKSQHVTSSWGGRRKLPLVFTEQGVAMLSSVLNSVTAIDVNIQIIRVFTKMRALLSNHKDLLLALEKLRGTVSHNSRDIKVIFNHLKRLHEEERDRALLAQIPKKRPSIGFKKGKA
ncbi:MAG: ORF6N domain-containing protein [Flavobacteriales bacterium]|nr:ORF6N domain-containing protein [Flavobacteriales bacterium]